MNDLFQSVRNLRKRNLSPNVITSFSWLHTCWDMGFAVPSENAPTCKNTSMSYFCYCTLLTVAQLGVT